MPRYYPHQLRANPDLLRGQFILCEDEGLIPRSWECQTHGRWTLGCSAPLTCSSITGPHGRTTGWILGHAVSAEGRYLRPGSGLRLDDDAADIQTAIDGVTGRFIAIDLTREAPRVQVDTYGMLGAVYAPGEACVASTAMLVPLTSRHPYDLERIVACEIPYRTAMYPLGFTPRRGIERVLPNHVVDLGSWRAQRRWPSALFTAPPTPQA